MIDQLNQNQIFIKKLSEIILKNIADENFGAKELVSASGMSNSGLNRRLHKIINKNINQFIREIRLNKALEMLQNEDISASEVAYKAGFSSPTYFNKCFHDYYGFPPGEVKKREVLDPGLEEITAHKPETIHKLTSQALFTSFLSKSKSLKFKVIAFILILIVALVTFFIIFNYHKNQNLVTHTSISSFTKSIAVLPFKNLSENKENLYFADGVMEGILNHLFRIKELRVISRTSVEQFRGSTLSSPQIAEKLGINYLLEGSVERDSNKVRIFVQLIDARQDQHIYVEEFDRKVDDIFTIQSEIAKQIASELQVVLSAKEIEHIEKIPTKNPEAYNFYLKGRFFWKWRTEEGLKESITYFEKAVAADTGYALAYAGLADAYFIQAWWGWSPRKEGYAMAKKTALQALELNNNLAEAHATLGDILAWSEWKWEDARKELQLATELNPNYITAHQYYSELLDILGENAAARVEIDHAIELDPFVPLLYSLSSIYYYHEGKYEEGLRELSKEVDIHNHEESINTLGLFLNIHLKQGEDLKAVKTIQKILQRDSLTLKYVNTVKDVYKQSGMTGVLNLYIKLQLLYPRTNPSYIAFLYALSGNKKEALDWLEKTLAMHFSETSEIPGFGDNIPRIANNPGYDNLRTEPRFKDILRKMGLSEYYKQFSASKQIPR